MPVTTMRVASAPVSFGIDEIMQDDAWMPAPDDMLDWMVDIGFEGTELGHTGLHGRCRRGRTGAWRRAASSSSGRSCPSTSVGPRRSTRTASGCARSCACWPTARHPGRTAFAVLSDHFDEPDRRAFSGRIEEHPEAWLSDARFDTLIDNLHAVARICRDEGFEPVVHPHAGTYIETADEIARVMDRIDPSVLGLCLDTGHFRFGGADPTQAVHDYHHLIRHVHIKDCTTSVMDDVKAEGKGLDEALRRGVFCQLGAGDSGIDGVIEALRTYDYAGWLVIEQDQFLGPSDTPESVVAGQRANRDYLRALGI